jgi:hypothetical protein
MLIPVYLARRSYPLALTGGDDKLALFDWCGEIINRLLGRIKQGLAVRGVDIEASTPRAVMAEHIQLVASERNSVCALRFHCGEGVVAVLVDAISQSQIVFRAPVSFPAAPPPEGELLLF